MQIDLSEEIASHFKRLTQLADMALDDDEQSYSSRTAPMTSLSTLIAQLTRSQAEVVNMEALIKTEQALIEAVREYLEETQMLELLSRIEEAYGKLN